MDSKRKEIGSWLYDHLRSIRSQEKYPEMPLESLQKPLVSYPLDGVSTHHELVNYVPRLEKCY